MDFKLDKQHEMALQLFKDFAENEVKPLAQETDETEQFPTETVEKMKKLVEQIKEIFDDSIMWFEHMYLKEEEKKIK